MNKNNQKQSPQMRPGGHGRFGKNEKPKDIKKSLSRLVSYLARSKKLLFGLMFAVILSTLANLSANILIKNVVSSLGSYNSDLDIFEIIPNQELFIRSLLMLLGCYLIYSIMQYFSSLFGAYLSTNTVRTLRNDLFSKIVRLPISYIDSHPHGDVMSRMTNDVDNISNALSSSLASLISGLLTILGCLAIMLWYSPLLTVVSLSSLILTLIFTKFMSKYMRPLFSKQQIELGKINSQTEEMVTGIKTVTAYNKQKSAINEFNKYSDEFTRVGIKAQILGGSMGPVMNFIGNFGYFLVCISGSIFILNGIGNGLMGQTLTISVVIMFLSTNKQFTRPINEIAQLYSSLLTALAGAERVFGILDEKSEDFSSELTFDASKVDGVIDFEHIDFSYLKGRPVLKDFHVDIRKGHKIALVGATGSGKTTIVNLLLRFYDIDAGRILIDGVDIAKISKKELRKTISIVLQDPVLFGDSIENNIRYAKEDATDEEIDEALDLANCLRFVNKLPEGKKTVLAESASNISQGQRQLLTIARAVLADPKILILDEATSSVDTRTEKKIQDAMVKLMDGRTSIIIAHRLSTIQDANLIVVLDKGHVVEMGNHEELLKYKGVYNRLYQTQFKGLDT